MGASRAARLSGAIAWLIVVGTLALAVAAPLVAPFDPRLPVGRPFQPPGSGHLFGTNDLGQDIFSQWLWGARSSATVAIAAALLSTVLSWTVGIAAGFWRRVEPPLMAIAELLLALPSVPLYMLVVALVGPSQSNLIVTLGLLSWPGFARIVRAQVLGLRQADFVEAARALGAGEPAVAWRHVLPATLNLLPAKLILTVRFAIFAEATLAFLGLGDAASQSWGTVLSWAFNDGLLFARPTWVWWVGPPTLAIVLVVLATTRLAVDLDRRLLRAAPRQPREETDPGSARSPA